MPVLSYFMHDNILSWIKGSAMPTAPVSLKLALFTDEPDPDGTSPPEVGGGLGYSRQTVAFGSVVSDAGISSIKNTGAVVFGPATSTWPPVTHCGVYTVGGDLVAYGPLPAQRTAPIGDTISFGINAVQIRIK